MEISRLMLIRNHWIWTSKHKAFNSINSFFWLIDWVVICCLIWSWYDWETDIWWGIFESWDWVFWSRNSLKSQLLKLTTRTNSSISGKQMTWQLYQSYQWKSVENMTQNVLFISESPHLHHWVTLPWRAPQHSWVCTVDLTCLPTILSPPPTLLSTLVLLLHSGNNIFKIKNFKAIIRLEMITYVQIYMVE